MTHRAAPSAPTVHPGTLRHVPALHVVTDTRAGRDPLPDVRAAVATGPCAVQVRSKELTDRDVLQLTLQVLEIARPAGALVLVDDRVDVALAAGADGVHLGVTDLPVDRVRALAPPGFVIGATARDAVSARAAEMSGATYLGVGPAYATTTKVGLPEPLGPDGVAAVVAATRLPVVAIGGVTADRVALLRAAGAHGVAVVTALSEADDPRSTAAALAAALAGHPPAMPPAPRASGSETGTTTDHQ
ncbi:thiamine phosphate synthase [Terrabacter sp. GCM10028922]|uniref:thiamine phosphate synthase n=1 Tax=Terrabacter sp. GCM10028922 TaxID=3273428 RepID=UPI00360A0D84